MTSLVLEKIKWRPGFHIIGFALFKRTTDDKYVAKFGIGHGFKEETDVEHIREYGIRMSFEEAKGFFPNELTNEDDYSMFN